ncbi:endonuclease MutS2 [Robertkochia aurantiaca]|uniref:endonuclease MutS2 n=1 Tax=Robertkochia aurantiaca TaxID=2873700 RepID=UPI001CCF9BD6|nr:DNA mismatch repair protein MutS [Robertkochia sp. 3YJGBD-33]
MNKIHQKTIQDLELQKVLQQISAHCTTDHGKEAALKISPFSKEDTLMTNLSQTNEYLASFENNNRIPNHYFEAVDNELRMLGIENAVLSIEGLRSVAALSSSVNGHIDFFRKFTEYYPTLFKKAERIYYTREIIEAVDKVIDRFGEVKDNASDELAEIRKRIAVVRTRINQSFSSALSSYASAGYLDDIRETVIDNKRVLAVKAMYRKKVKGAPLGQSKTGSIVYIEPEVTQMYTREYQELELEEKEEIQRILKELTNILRPFKNLIAQYQVFLTDMDVFSAKARYAQDINGLLPEITSERKMHFIEAFHPLLYLTNKEKGEITYPQTVELEPEKRIIVISGPNAGGKSITLKTVGLLQLMLQSGILIPVHERSVTCLFDRILTDIGDNQSIENHLSTYSYRLKNMNYFLRKCNEKTLFLIDEFGTGSDPELGGALAETFLEVFYEREAFGIITTHYANLKMLANDLPYAINANMLFDSKTLQPVFKLILGEAGSSFTFEVAQKNGIPYGLINKAKKKIERGKVRFDATIAKLQKERSQVRQTSSSLREEEAKTREENKRLEELNTRIRSKLESYQELYDHNQRMIYLGNKINDIAEKYFINKKKRPLISEFLRIVETENSKRKKEKSEERKARKKEQEIAQKEVSREIKEIRQRKKKEKETAKKQPAAKPRPVFKVGDRVRLIDGRAIGTIDTLEKNKAIVNYGMFTTEVSTDKLDLVEASK